MSFTLLNPFKKPINLMCLRPSILSLTLFLVFTFGLFACQNQQNESVKTSLYVFGTTVDINIYNADKDSSDQAIREVEQTFHQMHKEWHAWEKGGILSKINNAIANNRPIDVPSSVKDFILKSQKLSQQSQGLFDPAIGGLINLWGFHGETWQGPPPSKQKIQAWLENRPSIQDIHFTENTLSSENSNVQLDFGGNAKGLAIDIALNTLKKSGIKNALVSIGGDMKAIGSKNDQAWSIGVQSPKNPAQAIARIELNSGESLVSSGDYQRFFEWQGKQYSHILNPNTGYPAQHFSSVTVLHNDATTADAAATAILIAGPNNWLNIAKSMEISHVMCIDKEGNILQTEAMNKRIKLLNKTR